MACGLKKQSNQEGGVHLTERTCSPYNPIIKLMVDDCLGLPIYPVSSVDAVIDEDGKTLRLLLAELTDLINNGGESYEDIIEKLRELRIKIEGLGDTYIDNDELTTAIAAITEQINGLKAWLMLISKYDLDSSSEDREKNDPNILKYLSKLKNTIDFILNILGIDPNNPDPQDGSLVGRLNTLTELVHTIAKCGNESITDTDGIVWIVKYVLQLLRQVDGLDTATGSIKRILDDLQDQINSLSQASTKFAHLEEVVLSQAPATATDLSDYLSLKISEYPPTTAKFLTIDNILSTGLTDLTGVLYLGSLPSINVTGEMPDVFPFGHVDLDKGYPLYYSIVKDVYIPINVGGVLLRMGDGIVSGDDINKTIEIILNGDRTPLFSTGLLEPLPEGVTYDKLYIWINGSWQRVGDYNQDGEVNLPDVNAFINIYISELNRTITRNSSYNIPAPISSNTTKGWLMYKKKNGGIVYYPCIEGKLYIDELTGNLYRYSDNNMIQVGINSIVSDSLEVKYLNNENTTDINLSSVTKCIYLDNPSDIDNLTTPGTYVILPKSHEYILGAWTDTSDEINVDLLNDKYSVGTVTRYINNLLSGVAVKILQSNTPNNIESLRILEENLGTLKDYVQKYTVSSEELTNTKGELINALEGITGAIEDVNGISDINDNPDAHAASIIEYMNSADSKSLQTVQRLILPTSVLLQGTNQTSYIWYKDGDKYESTALTKNKAKDLYVQIHDMDDNDIFNITDVTLMITNLLNGKSGLLTKTIYDTYEVKKIVKSGIGVDVVDVENLVGRIFLNPDTDEFWYIISEEGEVKRFPKYQLASNELSDIPTITLYQNGVELSTVRLTNIASQIQALSARIDNLENSNQGE